MQRRWTDHVSAAKRVAKGGRWHFPNAIRKYGPEAFSHEVLEVCHDLEVANLAEECWIEFYDTRNPEKGFNLAKGGQHRPHPIRRNPWDDPEFRASGLAGLKVAFSASQTPAARATLKTVCNTHEAKQRARDSRIGKKTSPETKAKLSAFMKTRPISDATRDKLRVSNKSADPSVRLAISRGCHLRRGFSGEDLEKLVAGTHHFCEEHGLITVSECYTFASGRLYCKLCRRNRNRQRWANRQSSMKR